MLALIILLSTISFRRERWTKFVALQKTLTSKRHRSDVYSVRDRFRSLKFAVDFDAVCVPRQIVLFLKNLDIQDSSRNKLRFTAVAMLNVVVQRAIFDEDDTADVKLIIDVCRDALKSMTDIARYSEDDDADTILRAVALLCGTCDSVSR